MIDFKGACYPKDAILYAVFFYVRDAVSYSEHLQNETLAGIETAHMIRKGQLYDDRLPAYKQFMALAA